jgi:hypothetical protein
MALYLQKWLVNLGKVILCNHKNKLCYGPNIFVSVGCYSVLSSSRLVHDLLSVLEVGNYFYCKGST